MKKTIAVIFGGDSVEHDISIITGLQTIAAIDKDKYEVIPVYLKGGVIYFGDSLGHIESYIIFREYRHKKGYFRQGKLYRHILGLSFPYGKIDCALLCTHGGEGENGVLQGYLAYCRIPFTSPGVFQCSLFMDKAYTKQMAQSMGIATLPWHIVKKGAYLANTEKVIKKATAKIPYPIIVKPSLLGSSIGISRASDDAELIAALDLAFMFGDKVLLEPALVGFREVNIALFRGEGQEPIVSELEEVFASDALLSFEDKYIGSSKGMAGAKREMPANIPKDIKQTIEKYSKKIYSELDCKGVVRIDYLVKGDIVYFNEVNSIPGSLSFYLFSGKSMEHGAFIGELINSAIKINDEQECLIKKFHTSVLENLKHKGEKGGARAK